MTTKQKNMKTIKGFKGFDKNLKCRDKQYEVGKTFEEDVNPKICEKGMHFCESPFDVFSYYPPATSRYCEVEGDGKISKGDDKTSTSKLKIKAEIGLGGLITAGVKFCLDKVNWEKENTATGSYSGASATGNCSGASATGSYSGASATGYKSGASATGNCSGASATGSYSGASATGSYSGASATGNCSGASATGYKSGASAGPGSVALATGMLSRAKGDLGSFIVITECEEVNNEYFIKDVKCAKVDGDKIKENTWYNLADGEFREANEDAY